MKHAAGSSTVVIFTPSAVRGLSHWFDAADASSVVVAGGLVNLWSDKSGLGRHAVQLGGGQQFTHGLGLGPNGLNVMLANGSQGMSCPAPSCSSSSLFAVVRSSVSSVVCCSSSDPSAYLYLGTTSAGDSNSYVRVAGAGVTADSPPFVVANYILAEGHMTGTQAYSAQDGNMHTPVTLAGAWLPQLLGQYSSTGLGVVGGICEVLSYSPCLSPADANLVRAYLAAKWRLY